MKRKKGFTLIELIAVLVILAILALIVTPLVMNIIRKAKDAANKRSIDAYGRSVELAIATHLLDTGTFPTNLQGLQVEYTGKTVSCNVMQMKENGGLYLSECTVGGKDVKDSKTDDGWYHYGTRDLTNEDYVDMYGDALKKSSIAYYTENNQVVSDYTTLTIDYKGKPVSCDVTVNYDGTIYMTNCKVNNTSVTSETEEDGYYHYGNIVNPPTAVNDLLAKANGVSVTNYSLGNTEEMYTFSHPATEQTGTLTDYRYIGANPNNYVTFNNELWRIVGVFTVDDGNGNLEQRVKIVRNEKIDRELYYAPGNTGYWPASSGQLNETYYNELSNDSKNMIVESKYYFGYVNGSNSYSTSSYLGTAEDIYSWERSTSSNWTGKIAFPYASDYVYTYALGIDNNCFNDINSCDLDSGTNLSKSWFYDVNDDSNYWFLAGHPCGNLSLSICTVYSQSYPNVTVYYHSVKPTLYLNSNVKITSGDGSEQHPYQLSM